MTPFADAETLHRVMPLLAHTCDRLVLVFGGVAEGYGDLPAALSFSDALETSPSYKATFYVPLPGTVERIEAAALAKRAEFARAATQLSTFNLQLSPQSWGDPEGGDSGTDYQRS